jgi:hypothetical protein
MSYCLQVQRNDGWFTTAFYCGGYLDAAVAACKRTVFSQKSASRVIGAEDQEIVHEAFYNVLDDPDENWREEYKEPQDLSWQEVGF